MWIVRLVGFAVAGLAAVGVFVLAGPDDVRRFQPVAVEGNQELIDQALADYETNFIEAGESVELQIVANGWIVRDLLFIVANQLDAQSDQLAALSAQTVENAQSGEPDHRVPGLLLVGVLTLGFHAATVPWASRGRSRPARDEETGSVAAERAEPELDG